MRQVKTINFVELVEVKPHWYVLVSDNGTVISGRYHGTEQDAYQWALGWISSFHNMRIRNKPNANKSRS